MTVGIDTTILLYSLNPGSRWHQAAVDFLSHHFGDPSIRVALTTANESDFKDIGFQRVWNPLIA